MEKASQERKAFVGRDLVRWKFKLFERFFSNYYRVKIIIFIPDGGISLQVLDAIKSLPPR
jgi:hypothetical protein